MTDSDDIDGGSRLARDPAVAHVELDGEAVLYHEQLRTVCVLNPTATAIWVRLDGTHDLDTVAADLAAASATAIELVRRDVIATARDLGDLGVLEGVAPDRTLVAELTLAEPDQPA
jgi:hypothetical protein